MGTTNDGTVEEAAPDRDAAAGRGTRGPGPGTPEPGLEPELAATARRALLDDVLGATPAFVHVLRGPDCIIEFANAAYLHLVGHRDVVGRPAFEALPEAAAGGYPERIARVMATGEPFVGRELPVTLARTPGAPLEERLIDLTYLPLPDPDDTSDAPGADARGARRSRTRVLGYGADVTEHVAARRAAEAREATRRAELEAANARLADANARLQDQQVELARTNRQLRDTAAELEARADALRATAAALDVERARLAAVFRQSPSFLAVLRGPDYVFVTVNDAYTRLVGGRDVLGEPVLEALPELRGQGFDALLDRVVATGEPFVGREVPIRLAVAPGGPTEARLLDFQYLPLVEADDAGAPRTAGVIAHGVDVTEQVLARREVERLLGESERARAEADTARAEAERANRAKSEFLAAMSHELRTPLNAIGGYAQLLQLGVAGPVTEVQRDYLARLDASGRHLLGLVNDVLDLAKVDAGKLAVVRERATAEAAVTAALDLVRPQATARGVALAYDAPADADPGVGTPPDGVAYVGDEHRVRQVLVNLLSNAVKFTEPGGAVTVTGGLAEATPPAARLDGAGPWAWVRVADTGVGIAPEEQVAVFEPFHQVERGHTRTRGGTGLGLAISRRLARLMGGDLTLESAPGVGSAFTLWLPSAAPAADGAGQTAEAWVARAARTAPGLVRSLGELGAFLRGQLDALVGAYAARLRAQPDAPRARDMQPAELEDHLVTALADLAQSLVLVGEAGTAETGLLADSVAINTAVADRHGARRFAQGWDVGALRVDYRVPREVLARAVRADARASGADAEAALGVLLGLVGQSEGRAVSSWHAAHASALDAAAPGGGAPPPAPRDPSAARPGGPPRG